MDIDPKKGSITVSKEVSNREDCEDEFYIKIQGAENSNRNEVYDFTVKTWRK